MENKTKKVKNYRPSFERITENQEVFIDDNGVQIINKGTVSVFIEDHELLPKKSIIMPLVKRSIFCKWNFYLIFEVHRFHLKYQN